VRFVRRYDLRKTKDGPRWGFVYMRRHQGVPSNLDVFLGKHLFAFWGKK